MFAVHCPQHGSRVMIWPSGVRAVRNTDAGIEVDYRCSCGYEGTWLTGRRASDIRDVSLAERDVDAVPSRLVGLAG